MSEVTQPSIDELETAGELIALVDDAKDLLYSARRRVKPASLAYTKLGAVLSILDDLVE